MRTLRRGRAKTDIGRSSTAASGSARPDRITRSWTVKNFMAGLAFFDRVAQLAEDEGHHPDLHLVGYRNVTIDIWTHAIGGLSLNDFILAAKIDRLPIDEK